MRANAKNKTRRLLFFCLVESGFAEIKIHQDTFICSAPAFLCLNEKETLENIHSKNLKAISIYFLPTFINRNMTFDRIYDEQYKDLCDVHDRLLLRPFLNPAFTQSYVSGLTPEIVHKAHELMVNCGKQLVERPDWYWSYRARSEFLDCLHLMERIYYSSNSDIGSTSFDCNIPIGKEYILKILNYIWQDYSNINLNASAIITKFHANKDLINKDFKIITGKTLYQYILEYRLYAAEHKLRFTHMSVDEIAESSGFANTTNFSTIFKSKKGFSPSVFRKHVMEKWINEIK